MREIDECTAEVFRRSEKRIKKRRKNRNRILALCMPFCLIVTVWSARILPAMVSSKDKKDGVDIMYSVEGSGAAYVQVEVKGTGNAMQSNILKKDTDEVEHIYSTMQSVFVNAGKEGDNAADDGNEEEIKDLTETENTVGSGYKAIFTAENGVKTVFFVTKDKLINESANQKVTLTEAQYAEIIAALGLTVAWEEEP